MMKFRRSIKSDTSSNKHDSTKPVQISIPQKDAIAIEPPKKVIKALYDYTAPSDPPHYLSFSAGDFLHVVSRENDSDWYEACNPLLGTRGLVPVKYFSEVGKTVRDSGDSSKTNDPSHDSGFAEGGHLAAAAATAQRNMPPSRTSAQNGGAAYPDMPMHRASKSVSKAGGVYGIVAYDFHAERPDELDAKAGEAIIVIAQSNPEWFVAKPITRLGGPGLIPVSFIEIRDMTTGRRADDPSAAVSQAGIPRVEDWKRMAAEYKNTSIPLGTVTTREQAVQQNLQQGIERMSLDQGGQQALHANNGNGHQRSPSNYRYQQQQEANMLAAVRASVPKFTFADEKFHFVVECRLSNGTHWDLSRIYEDFYELQISLIGAFPDEAGQGGKPRTLPYMPGPVKFVTDNISEGRRANLDEYLRDLLKMAPHVTSSALVRNFFHPRDGDYEVDPAAVDFNEHARPAAPQQQRQSSLTQNAIAHNDFIDNPYPPLEQQRTPPAAGVHQYSQSQASNGVYGHQRGQSSMASTQPVQHNHARSESQYTIPNNASGPQEHASNPSLGNAADAPPVKVKAWFDRDTCVVIRMPPRHQFAFNELYMRIAERRRLEFKNQPPDETDQLDIEYRDEKDGEYYRLEGDEDLDIAVDRNEKLTLAVRAARE